MTDTPGDGSDWLLLREPVIRNVFALILVLGFVGGAFRFLFPFQILNLGGTESIISVGGSLSSIGQIIGLVVLSRVFLKQRSALGASSVLFFVFVLMTGISSTPETLLISRLAEGAGSGLLVIVVIRISSGFEHCRGESIGTLLAGAFLGAAVGQGVAGLVVGSVESLYSLTQTEAIKFLGLGAAIVYVLLITILIPFNKDANTYSITNSNRSHGHGHLRLLLRSLMSKNLIVLLMVYILYDFSHGIYTPGLSIMINNNGIPIDQIGLGYLTSDAVWGAAQLFTGRLVDRTGSVVPLVVSLVSKGIIVMMYPYASSFLILTALLASAGVSEGLLEPARNDAAMEFTPTMTTRHTHKHYLLGHAPGTPFSISSHSHEHAHESGSDEIVSVLQTVGILGFALGSGLGGWLLIQGLTLIDLVFVGGVLLIAAGTVSSGLRWLVNRDD